MKNLSLLLFFGINLLWICEGLENYLAHPLYPCIKCLCHARTGCWLRQNCARYSISEKYWRDAGALTTNGRDTRNSYRNCMWNENCIVGTIISYTEKFGKRDCNCDGSFDCKDRLAIHLFGDECENPKFNSTYARRFNECAAQVGVSTMLDVEGHDNCNAPEVE
ncbi:hypothetical protein NQ315_000938 [Exocentrus adspersus]|uniref:lysozyme n=1 Tax=Exocentrus adspersus TaxID=1586481 RepID=A0AAV8WFC2_9CUCU|nr:hypothetical protein NQ315_000938 [Exocentrus adspersus]